MKCFLSYARKDIDFAKKLTKDIHASGVEVWWDPQITPGSTWDKSIETAIIDSDVFLIALSPNSVDSEFVLNEIDYAAEKGKTILPLLVATCEIPLNLRRRQWIDFTRDYPGALARLFETIQKAARPGEQGEDGRLQSLRDMQAKSAKYGLITILVIIGFFYGLCQWMDRPIKGIRIVKDVGHQITYEVNSGIVVFRVKCGDYVPTIFVDVNRNNQIDTLIDKSYGLDELKNDSFCVSYLITRARFGMAYCGSAPSKATLERSNGEYIFRIPIEELRLPGQSGAIWVNFEIEAPRIAQFKLYPDRKESYDLSKVYKLNI